MVRDAEVAQLEGEGDEVRQEVWSVKAAVDEDGAVDIGVCESGEGRGLSSSRVSKGKEDRANGRCVPRGKQVDRRCYHNR